MFQSTSSCSMVSSCCRCDLCVHGGVLPIPQRDSLCGWEGEGVEEVFQSKWRGFILINISLHESSLHCSYVASLDGPSGVRSETARARMPQKQGSAPIKLRSLTPRFAWSGSRATRWFHAFRGHEERIDVRGAHSASGAGPSEAAESKKL